MQWAGARTERQCYHWNKTVEGTGPGVSVFAVFDFIKISASFADRCQPVPHLARRRRQWLALPRVLELRLHHDSTGISERVRGAALQTLRCSPSGWSGGRGSSSGICAPLAHRTNAHCLPRRRVVPSPRPNARYRCSRQRKANQKGSKEEVVIGRRTRSPELTPVCASVSWKHSVPAWLSSDVRPHYITPPCTPLFAIVSFSDYSLLLDVRHAISRASLDVGRWTVLGTGDVVVLSKDHSARFTSGDQTVTGTYRMGAHDVIILTLPSTTPTAQPQTMGFIIRPDDWATRSLRRP